MPLFPHQKRMDLQQMKGFQTADSALTVPQGQQGWRYLGSKVLRVVCRHSSSADSRAKICFIADFFHIQFCLFVFEPGVPGVKHILCRF